MLRSSRRRLLQQQIDAMNERIATLENDNREFRAQLHEAQRRLSVMADDDPNKKAEGMSQGVATKYRALFKELRFAKQQQWMATNYLLLVLAAIFGIGTAIKPFDRLRQCKASCPQFRGQTSASAWRVRNGGELLRPVCLKPLGKSDQGREYKRTRHHD